MKSYEEFEATINAFPYQAQQSRKDRIIKNYNKLEVGMSKEQVLAQSFFPSPAIYRWVKERTGDPAGFIGLRRQLQLKLFESPMNRAG